MLVGDALGRAMVRLLGGKAAALPKTSRPKAVAKSPDPAQPSEPSAEDKAKAHAALKPIIMDSMIPHFLSSTRNRVALLTELSGEKPQRISQFLQGTRDTLTGYYRAAGIHEYDWRRFGPNLDKAKWDYFSFDPKETRDKKKGSRFRKVMYPQGMTNWFAADFDAAKAGWKKGQQPFGQLDGKLALLSELCTQSICGCGVAQKTLWEKEVLLLRGTFEIPPLKEGHQYRIVVGGSAHVNAGDGYAIYVNGKLLAHSLVGVGKWQGAQPRGGFLYNDFLKEFQGGKVTLAATSFLRYNHPRFGLQPPRGHISLWLEEAKMPPLGHADIVKSATVSPMLSTSWQENQNNADKFQYDGAFASNPKVLGSWKIIDQVKTVDEFNADKKMNPGRPRFTEITFKEKGETNDMLWIWSGNSWT
jgi:hypothetical protein